MDFDAFNMVEKTDNSSTELHLKPIHQSEAFAIARYNFILSEIQRLNENTHKHLKLFQGLAPVLATSALTAFYGTQKLGISPEVASTAIFGILLMVTFLGIFVAVSILSDVASWIDYRKEEVALLDSQRIKFRLAPTYKNAWRWFEIHAIGFLSLFVILSWILSYKFVFPLLILS